MEQPNHTKRILRRGLLTTLCLLMAAVLMMTCARCTKPTGSSEPTEAEAATEAPVEETQPPYDALNFKTPDIPDDGAEGYYSAVDPGLYIYNNTAFELCGASDEAGKDYAAAISEFKKAAPNVKVYNMVVPTHTEYGLPRRLCEEVYSSSQSQNIKTIYSSYSEDVQPINCYNALCDHIKEYIYFNTDHHWTGLGAYYAYQAFCEQTGQTPLDLSKCTENVIDGFEGSFYGDDPSLNPDSVHYWDLPYQTHASRQEQAGEDLYETSIYAEGCSGSGAYITFIGGDSSLFIE